MAGKANEQIAMIPGVDVLDRRYDTVLGVAMLEAYRDIPSSCGPLAVEQLKPAERMDGRSVQRDVVRFMAESVADTIEIAEMRAAELGGTDGPRRTPESDR